MAATDTTPVTRRFTNSIIAGASVISAGVSAPSEQFGQSVQPRPEPVRRTVAPVTTIAISDAAAKKLTRRYALGDKRRTATTPPMVGRNGREAHVGADFAARAGLP